MWKIIFVILFFIGPVYADETIQIIDDKVNPVETQKVTITDTDTKVVVVIPFEGTQNDLISILSFLTKQRDTLNDQIISYQTIKQKVDIEISKLPPRIPKP